MPQRSFSIAESGAFVSTVVIEPTASGPLDGLSFAVKDLIDAAGHTSSCGNPDWLRTHPPATCHAVCIDVLLANGARCLGKTATDELAFGLLGENHFYGTPLNPRAPQRVPGGSSSGSASAVACGLVDFAVGTDTGGSVRVPASNCGIVGLRPSHDLISVAGVMPFASSFDTVGFFARDVSTLARVAQTFLYRTVPKTPMHRQVLFLSDALELMDDDARAACIEQKEHLLKRLGGSCRDVTLAEIAGVEGRSITIWQETFILLQLAEIRSSLSPWIESVKPKFGPTMAANVALLDTIERGKLAAAHVARERLAGRINAFLADDVLLCMPTAAAPAPLKGQQHPRADPKSYVRRTLGMTAIAGIGRLPQISLPFFEVAGLPLGLSLLAGQRQDHTLLAAAAMLEQTSA